MISKENFPQDKLPSIPDSLKFWLSADFSQKQLTQQHITRQIFDLVMADDQTWVYFQHLRGVTSSILDQCMREALAYRHITSAEKVTAYFRTELLNDEDPYDLISKAQLQGAGIRELYKGLLDMWKLENLSDQERLQVAEMMGWWEEAALAVICNKELYFTKTASGNTGTISEFLGSSIAYDVWIAESPNTQAGKYFQQILAAVDYEAIITSQLTREDFETYYRQTIILNLLYVSQHPQQKLSEDFWRAIEANQHFSAFSHQVAVQEGFPQANDLLVRALQYAWEQSLHGPLIYALVAGNLLDDHFTGKTAADTFLADPAMKFQERFKSDRSNVQSEYLWDYEQVSEGKPDYIVLLDCQSEGAVIVAQYAVVGLSYQERTIIINEKSGDVSEVGGDEAAVMLKLVNDFKAFRKNYLSKLHGQHGG